MSWFSKAKSIRVRVQEAIEAKIADGEQRLKELAKDEADKLKRGIEALTSAHDSAVESHAESIVNEIVK